MEELMHNFNKILDEKNIEEISKLGVDFLSMGALIHKAIWVDMSLQLYLPH